MNRIGFLIGLAFGFLLTAARVNDYDVIHNMLLLREPDLYLLMASAVGTAMPLLFLLKRRSWKTIYGGPLALLRYPVERKHILGAVVFGSGWAVAGTCPGPALAMVGGGGLVGIFTVLGLMTGLLLRDAYVAHAETRRSGEVPGGSAALSR